MSKLFIFDMDGTLLDSDLVVVLTWVELFKIYDPSHKCSVKELISFSGPPLKDSIKRMFPNGNQEEIRAKYLEISLPLYDRYATAYPYTRELILALKEKGYKVAINTNKIKSGTSYALSLLGMEDLFDCSISGDEVSKPKPDKEGVLRLMEMCDISSLEDVTYIGDSLFDYQTAENAGIRCILVNHGFRSYPDRSEDFSPDRIINGFLPLLEEIK